MMSATLILNADGCWGWNSPPQHGLGLKPQVLSNIVLKTPRIVELELYVRVIGLSTLSF